VYADILRVAVFQTIAAQLNHQAIFQITFLGVVVSSNHKIILTKLSASFQIYLLISSSANLALFIKSTICLLFNNCVN
jgi:hypothetical protein